jgi:AAA domain-containing protein
MIRVEELSITEFRGIRKLSLKLKGKNFAVSGPNGTGKSGVVDALEFGLTGNVSRLSGKGTGGISVKDHGPHVDFRNKPDKARVVLKVTIPSLGQTVLIDRSVKDARTPTITPSSPAITKVLEQVANHPEFVLSRRQLIDYVLATPGDRSREIQALLRLESVESVRTNLQKFANAAQRAVEPATRDKNLATEALRVALDVPQLSQDAIRAAVNQRRATLGLSPVAALTATTSLRDGLDASSSRSAALISKKQALADLQAIRTIVRGLQSEATASLRAGLVKELTDLNNDPALAAGFNREQLLTAALGEMDDEGCPVCDTPWDLAQLKAHVVNKLKKFEEVGKKRAVVEKQMVPLLDAMSGLGGALKALDEYGRNASPVISASASQTYRQKIREQLQAVEKFVPLSKTIELVREAGEVPADVVAEIDAIEGMVKAIPDPTLADAARDYLTIGQEKLETYRQASSRLKKLEAAAALTGKVFEVYGEVVSKGLDGLYKEVEKDFTEFYRRINEDDEGSFSAKLTPSLGKLGFDVDFYGRGFFPPGAYHSEGHQDGMGVCLYLALMKHMLGAGFTLAVLDDVLMSVDAGHRRKVCALLKTGFPNTQFILTTHDDVWHRHMRTEGLIDSSGFAHFRKWSVDEGPTEWDDRDVWKEIDVALGKHDVREAAGLMRHYLEYVSAEICHHLKAGVAFRGDGQYQLGDLLPNAIGQFRTLLKDGKVSAQSWSNSSEHAAIDAREKDFAAAAAASLAEQWQTNPAVHYNQWANFRKEDFAPVVVAYRRLLELMFCPKCGSCYAVRPDRGSREGLRCNCGVTNLNLKKKREKDKE